MGKIEPGRAGVVEIRERAFPLADEVLWCEWHVLIIRQVTTASKVPAIPPRNS